jgi:hypothetical protein
MSTRHALSRFAGGITDRRIKVQFDRVVGWFLGRSLVDRQLSASVFGDRQSRGLARVSTITMFVGTWNPSLSMCSVSTVEKRASTNALIALWEILNGISSRFVLRAREVSPGYLMWAAPGAGTGCCGV